MQYQKNKSDQKEKKERNKENTDSDLGEMIYVEPIGNQVISPESLGQDQMNETNENKSNEDKQVKSHRTILQTVKNDLKNKVDIAQLVDERPIHSIVVNVSSGYPDDKQEKSPKTINIGSSKEEIEYNIKTLNPRKSPDNNQYQTGTNPLGTDSRNLNSLNDSGGYQQIIFGPRNNASRSPDNFPKMKDYQFFNHDRRDRGGIIPFNNMSPNLNNFEDMNSSGEKMDVTHQTNNYKSFIGNSSQRNASTGMNYRYDRQKMNITNKNLYPNDDINEKYRNKVNNNMSYGDIKKIMRRFTKIYDPNRNNNGVLIESSQVVVPGAADDIFTNRFRVLSKMNRLSNILLSKKKRSPNKYEENSNLNLRSRTKSRSPIRVKSSERTGSPYMKKMPHNKFLYVSLAMLSSKGPKCEDRIILRKMRLDKGGVVDLAQEERKKAKYKIKKIAKNKGAISFYHTNPKYREIAARIIQEWWAELKVLYAKKLKKIILIQSAFRGKWVRKNMYDLLYLNYLYICFCRKIEKALSSYIRPLVFYKLFEEKKTESLILRNIVNKKEKRDNIQSMIPYWNKWFSIIKNQNLKNQMGKQLIDIRSHKENKLNILLAFFNKWRYLTKISNITPDQNINIYPLNKINGFCKIMDAAKKYVQKKALRKILSQLIKYLSIQIRENLLKKIIIKKAEYEKNILRNTLYLWYSKILNFRKASNEEEANKLREMRLKIFKVLILNAKRKINQRFLRKYLIRLYIKTHPDTINRYIIYEILRKIKIEELRDGEVSTINIHGRKYKIIKTKKDLRIIIGEEKDSEEEPKEEVVKNYEEIVTKIHKDKKGKYEEGEEIPSDVKKDLDDIEKERKEEIIRKKKISKKEEEESPEEDEGKRIPGRKGKKVEKKKKIEEEESEESERPTRVEKKTKKRPEKEKRKRGERYIKRREEESYEEESEYDEEIESEDSRRGRKGGVKSKTIPKRRSYKPERRHKRESDSRKRQRHERISESEEESEEYDDRERDEYDYERRRHRPYSERAGKGRGVRRIKRRVSPTQGRKVRRRYIDKDKRRDDYSPRDEYEEIEEEESPDIGRPRRKRVHKYVTRDKSYEEITDKDEYEKSRTKTQYEERERPKKRHIRRKRKDDREIEEEEESPEDRYEKRPKKKYIKKDRDGNEYIEEEVSSEEEDEGKRKDKRKIKVRRKTPRRKSPRREEEGGDRRSRRKKEKYEPDNKIDEVGENEESEEEESIRQRRRGEDYEDKYSDEGIKRRRRKRRPTEEEKPIEVYDKDGKRITNLEKYRNKDGDYDIDLYDKDGKRITDLKKYKRKQREKYPQEIFDKRGRRLINLEKYKNRDGDYDIELFDKNGKRINNLKKYINEDGDFTIPVYDKDNNIVINLEKYKNEKGDYDIDVYDKKGNKIRRRRGGRGTYRCI